MSLFLKLNNNCNMPVLGLGTWLTINNSTEETLDHALDAGYRHIDTATIYNNEKAIKNTLQKWLKNGKIQRNELFITTKLPPIGNYPERMEKYVLKSLENLQLDYVDLYLIHCPEGIKDPPPPNNGTKNFEMDKNIDLPALWKKMEEQVRLGRTKSIGVSNFNITQLQQVLSNARIKPVCNQIELNVYNQQKNMVDFCKQNNIAVVAYSPLGNPGINTYYSSYNITKPTTNLLNDSVIQEMARKYSKSPAQIALRFLIQQNIAAIPKSSNPKRLKENLEIFDFILNENDMDLLKKLDKGESVTGNWDSWTWVEEEGTIKF